MGNERPLRWLARDGNLSGVWSGRGAEKQNLPKPDLIGLKFSGSLLYREIQTR